MHLQPGFVDEPSHWLRLLLGHCRYELCLPRSVWWLLQTPPHFSLTVRFPYNPHGVRSEKGLPQSDPQCWGRLVVLPGSLFTLEQSEARGIPLHGAALSWRRGNVISSTVLMPVWVFQVKRSVSASPQPSKILCGIFFLNRY